MQVHVYVLGTWSHMKEREGGGGKRKSFFFLSIVTPFIKL